MAGILPATGQAIAMGAVYVAYGGGGFLGTATQAQLAGKNISLSGVLGVSYGGKSAATVISFSSTFGGKTTPYTYYGSL
jgi:hypothetical protein